MSLIGRVAALSRFVSRATDYCAPFFDVLKGSKKFKWIDKYERAFHALKEHLGRPPLLSKPIDEGKLYLYLAISKEVVSATLVKEEKKVQWPVYYISKRLLDAETRYPELEKLALALVIASKKLRSYFHAHLIDVLTNYPLHQVLLKPEASRRLLIWAIELGEFNVYYRPYTVINGHSLADLIAEFTNCDITEVAGMTDNVEVAKRVEIEKGRTSKTESENFDDAEQWTLYMDDASNENGSGAGMILINP